jgi:NAD+ diphosphatase
MISRPFQRLVSGLKELGKTVTVVESCCGGTINASIMEIPGSSNVFYGGSVAYNTKQAKKFLMNNEALHSKLTEKPIPRTGETEGQMYIRSKMKWTKEAAISFCENNDVDYAIAEGGASGPTFRPEDLDKGFSVIAIAGKGKDGKVELLAQDVIRSPHANREANMRLFADAAARLAADTIGIRGASKKKERDDDSYFPWLDRSTSLRANTKELKALEERSDAQLVVLKNSNECLFSSDLELSLLPNEGSMSSLPKTFLGIDHQSGKPIFWVEVDDSNEHLLELPSSDEKEYYFNNTRTHASFLTPEHYELSLYATAMSNWRRTHKFCSICGQPLEPIQGGTCLKCTSCESLSWPRQDPSIIVLITNQEGNKALLARSPRHPNKVHTALAGFVEAGETFENAVMREAYEETGVRVDPESIMYLSSQPWPFPRSTMIGFRATANDQLPLDIDTNELVSAEWFDKNDVMQASIISGAVMNKNIAEETLLKFPSLNLLIPPKGVLAHSLIEDWLKDSS